VDSRLKDAKNGASSNQRSPRVEWILNSSYRNKFDSGYQAVEWNSIQNGALNLALHDLRNSSDRMDISTHIPRSMRSTIYIRIS